MKERSDFGCKYIIWMLGYLCSILSGMDLLGPRWGCTLPLPLARGSAGGAIFHDNASWWPGGTHSMLRDCRKIGNASNCALVQCGRLLHLLFGGIFGTLTESNRRRPHDCSDWHSYMTVLAAPRGSQYSRNSNAIVFGSIMQCSENLDYSQRVKEQPAV
jgi:hypothetical protein